MTVQNPKTSVDIWRAFVAVTIYISLSMLKFFSGILNEAVIILVLTYGSIFHKTAAQTALKLRRTSLQ